MKIDIVTMSTNDFPLFYELWEPVSKVWKTKFGIHPVLAFCGDTYVPLSEEYGDVIYLPKVGNIPSYIPSVWARFYITKFYPDQVCMEVDIDIFPLSKKYFIDDLKPIDDSSYTHLDWGIYSEGDNKAWQSEGNVTSGCYHVAKGSTFNQVYRFLDWEEEMERLDSLSFNQDFSEQYEEKWAIDEIYSSHKLREAQDSVVFDFSIDNYHAPDVDRSSWLYSKKEVTNGYYMDSHLLRPYSIYKKDIDQLASLIPNYND